MMQPYVIPVEFYSTVAVKLDGNDNGCCNGNGEMVAMMAVVVVTVAMELVGALTMVD